METYFILGLSIAAGFVATVYKGRINARIQVAIAISIVVFSLVSFFAFKGEKMLLIMVILGISWIIKSIKEIKSKSL